MKIVVWVILSLLLSSVYARDVNSDQVKAAYVYNFLKHTNWSNESSFYQYHILVASKNENLKNMFLMLASRKTLNDKKIKVTFYDGKTSPKNIQALYTDDQSGALHDHFFNEYEKEDVLLISDGYKDKRKVMINLFENDQIVTFEINKANILNRSLKVSPDLVLLGGSEIDVAKLYKSSQTELKEQKETILTLNKKIKERNEELEEKTSAIEKQKSALKEQEEKIETQYQLISKQQRSINDQKSTISTQQNELEMIHQNITIQKEKLLREEMSIKEKESVLKQLMTSLGSKEQEVDAAQKELEFLNREIETQKEKIVQKEGVISTQRGAITALLVLFGIILVLGWYVIKQNKLLNALSQTDPLTGLYNRRVFMEKVSQMIEGYVRYHTPFTLLLIDLDHFKNINDTYGHNEGDRILKSVSELIKIQTRETDICVRWGGEEFMVVASNTDRDNGVTLAHKLQETIANHPFDIPMPITISIGVSSVMKGDTIESIVKAADTALYRAKEEGRNRVVY